MYVYLYLYLSLSIYIYVYIHTYIHIYTYHTSPARSRRPPRTAPPRAQALLLPCLCTFATIFRRRVGRTLIMYNDNHNTDTFIGLDIASSSAKAIP